MTRRTRRWGALLVVVWLLVLWPTARAEAHSALLATNPVDGATVDAVPAELSLTFSENVLALGTQILIDGPSGPSAAGTATIRDTVVTQPLMADAPAGSYTVRWRVTSADGHPITGQFAFTAQAEGGGTAPASTPSAGPRADGLQVSSGTGGLLIGLVAGLLVVLVVGLAARGRRR